MLATQIQQYIKRIIYNSQRGFIPRNQGRFNIWKSINVMHRFCKIKTKEAIESFQLIQIQYLTYFSSVSCKNTQQTRD